MSTRTHVDKNGELVRASPTSITTFDLKGDRFACQRKWYFQSVLGVERVKGPEAALGDAVHLTFENALDDRESVELTTGLLSGAKALVDRVKSEGVLEVELREKIRIADVDINMRIDVVTPEGVLDWKTIKDLTHKKTPGELRANHQLLLNLLAIDDGRPEFKVEHGYVETKDLVTAGKVRTDRTQAWVDRSTLDRYRERVTGVLAEMKAAARKKLEELPRADDFVCKYCSFSGNCPKENDAMTDLLARFEPEVSKRDVEVTQEVPAYLPPDAPKSDPAQAAVPVPGYAVSPATIDATKPGPKFEVKVETPKVEVKPRKARRQLVKEEAKEEVKEEVKDAATVPAMINSIANVESRDQALKDWVEARKLETQEAPAEIELVRPKVTVKSIHFSLGATVPTAQWASQRFEIGMTADVEGSVDDAYELLRAQVKSKLLAELESFALTLEGKKLNPNGK